MNEFPAALTYTRLFTTDRSHFPRRLSAKVHRRRLTSRGGLLRRPGQAFERVEQPAHRSRFIGYGALPRRGAVPLRGCRPRPPARATRHPCDSHTSTIDQCACADRDPLPLFGFTDTMLPQRRPAAECALRPGRDRSAPCGTSDKLRRLARALRIGKGRRYGKCGSRARCSFPGGRERG